MCCLFLCFYIYLFCLSGGLKSYSNFMCSFEGLSWAWELGCWYAYNITSHTFLSCLHLLMLWSSSYTKDLEFWRNSLSQICRGEISVICLDVKFLKEKFDERVPLSKSLSSSQTSCLLASSSSSRKSTSNNPILNEAETCGTPKKIAETAMIEDIFPETTFEEEKSRVDLKELTDLGWEFFDEDTLFSNGNLSPTANREFRGSEPDILGGHWWTRGAFYVVYFSGPFAE